MTDTYNFDVKIDTATCTIEIDTAKSYGYFQHNQTGTEGGLWFVGKTLADYDGVWELPHEVAAALKALGYSLEDEVAA